jgi:hypothetical protein
MFNSFSPSSPSSSGVGGLSSDFRFYGMSRIGQDAQDSTRQSIDSTRAANYMLSNFFESDRASTSWALSQPHVFFNTPWDARAVDAESYLKIQMQPQSPEKMFPPTAASATTTGPPTQRPFLTIPYLGRGSVDVNTESALRVGETIDQKKSVNTLSETNYLDLASFPLMEDWTRNNTVEEDRLPGRSGENTRVQ